MTATLAANTNDDDYPRLRPRESVDASASAAAASMPGGEPT